MASPEINEFPNLPTANFIKENTTVIGGETLILGLTSEQANDLLKYAESRGIVGEGKEMRIADTQLDDEEISRLHEKRPHVTSDSVTVYLGHTTDAHIKLFRSLGLE